MAEEVPGVQAFDLPLNFDQLREANNIWLRRAYVFIGIGTNAAMLEPLVPFQLVTRTQYDYGTGAASEAQHKHFLDEFQNWVIGNALRELVEGHSSFLAMVHSYLRVFLAQSVTVGQLQELDKEFDRLNVLRRREMLAGLLSVQDPFVAMFKSIVQARNCFAHRNGVVGTQDIDPGTSAFELVWKFHTLKIGGEYTDLNAEEPIFLEKDSLVQFGPVERRKLFKAGEPIKMTRHELAEIIFGFNGAAEALLEPFRVRAMAHFGVEEST